MAIISISPSTIPGLIKSIGADRTAAIISSITPYTTCREISKPSTIVFDTLDYLQKNDKAVWTSIEPKLCTRTGQFDNIPDIMGKTVNNVSIGVLDDKDHIGKCTSEAQRRCFNPNTLNINGNDYHIYNQYSCLFSSSHSIAGFAIFIYEVTGGKYFIYCPYEKSGNHELRECTSDSPKYVDNNYVKYEKYKGGYEETQETKNTVEEAHSDENTNDINTKNVESVDAETEVSRQTEICDELVDRLVDSLKKSKNLVLVGAPGMGKHYLALEIANSMKGEVMLVQFHPSYDYADFIEGIRPVQNAGFERKDGVFKQFCKCAINEMKSSDSSADEGIIVETTKGKPYILIIEDINRGDASKIFGELHVIDPKNRGEKKVLVQTKYQNLVSEGDVFDKGFYVPENVYIIATMNEIDVPAAKMDFAVRNLFAWKDIMPDDVTNVLNKLGENAEEAKKRMTNLNKCIADSEDLGPAYVVGPFYFLNLTTAGGFEQLWNDVIEPLLNKYLRGFRQSDAILEELKNAYNDYNL